MKYLFMLALLGCMAVSKVKGQLFQQVLNAAGNFSITGAVSLESNLGEVVTAPGSGQNGVLLTHGFLQPFIGTAAVPPAIPSLSPNALLYGIDNAGTSAFANNILLESTLGEWMTAVRIGGPYLLTQGLLQPVAPNFGPLPVTALTFEARRLNAERVELKWQTRQEVNNKGFYLERKKENENEFSTIKFVRSKAVSGNSDYPVDYWQPDSNHFGGKTLYRLKQEDVDGRISWSVIRMVSGISHPVTLKVWPVPAPKEFSVIAEGIDKDILQVFDLSGRLVLQKDIRAAEAIKISQLRTGTYFISLKGAPDNFQKVIVL